MDNLKMILGGLSQTARQNAADRLLYSDDLTRFIAEYQCGIFDVSKIAAFSDEDFISAAYYAVIGEMPDADTVQGWLHKAGKSPSSDRSASLNRPSQGERNFVMRCELMAFLCGLPDLERRQIVVHNQVYQNESHMAEIYDCKNAGHTSSLKRLKKRVVLMGYKVGRLLPLRLKVPLKNLYLKIAMRR